MVCSRLLLPPATGGMVTMAGGALASADKGELGAVMRKTLRGWRVPGSRVDGLPSAGTPSQVQGDPAPERAEFCTPLIELRSISMSFEGVLALDGVDFSVGAGEIRAIIGENGAGKSTLMKVLTGAYQPTHGKIYMSGREMRLRDPSQACKQGIAIVYQDLNLLPLLTAAENIALGREPCMRGGILSRKQIRERAGHLLERMGVDLDVGRPVGRMNQAERQMVAIARALSTSPRVLVLDEPTARLDVQDVRRLFEIVRALHQDGVTVVFISHRVQEVFDLCTSLTVLKDGKVVATTDITDITPDEAIEQMVGRKLSQLFPDHPQRPRGQATFSVRNLSSRDGTFEGVDLDVREGEIVTLAGLRGQGQKEIVRAIFGILPKRSGQILLSGREITIDSPRDAVQHGLAFLSDQRKDEGLVFARPTGENMTFVALRRLCSRGVVRQKREQGVIRELISTYEIHPPLPKREVRFLSGGNQQKVSFARWMSLEPKVVICDDPTAGIDAETKATIYKYLRAIADSGVAVLAVSSDMIELLGLSDRIYVINRGRVTAEFDGKDVTEETIIRSAI